MFVGEEGIILVGARGSGSNGQDGPATNTKREWEPGKR